MNQIIRLQRNSYPKNTTKTSGYFANVLDIRSRAKRVAIYFNYILFKPHYTE